MQQQTEIFSGRQKTYVLLHATLFSSSIKEKKQIHSKIVC